MLRPLLPTLSKRIPTRTLSINTQKKVDKIFEQMKQKNFNQSTNQMKQRQKDQSNKPSFYFQQAIGMLVATLPDKLKPETLYLKTFDDTKNFVEKLKQKNVQLTPPQRNKQIGCMGANIKQPDTSSYALKDYQREVLKKIHDSLTKIQQEENTKITEENTTLNTKN